MVASTLTAGSQPAAQRAARLRLTRPGGLLLGIAGVLLITLLSLRIGSLPVSNQDAWDAIFNYDPESYEQTVVRSLRLPRTVIGLGVGGALAVAGAMMQAVTRNPLADPSILGVSSGASFAIVTAIYYVGLTSAAQYVWFAFAGALVASALVFLIGSAGRDGPTPVKLALAGVVVSARSAPGRAPCSCSTSRRSTSSASGSPARSPGATWTPSGPSCPSCSAARSPAS